MLWYAHAMPGRKLGLLIFGIVATLGGLYVVSLGVSVALRAQYLNAIRVGLGGLSLSLAGAYAVLTWRMLRNSGALVPHCFLCGLEAAGRVDLACVECSRSPERLDPELQPFAKLPVEVVWKRLNRPLYVKWSNVSCRDRFKFVMEPARMTDGSLEWSDVRRSSRALYALVAVLAVVLPAGLGWLLWQMYGAFARPTRTELVVGAVIGAIAMVPCAAIFWFLFENARRWRDLRWVRLDLGRGVVIDRAVRRGREAVAEAPLEDVAVSCGLLRAGKGGWGAVLWAPNGPFVFASDQREAVQQVVDGLPPWLRRRHPALTPEIRLRNLWPEPRKTPV